MAADGFYEWQSSGRGRRTKQPWWFGLKGGDLFAFAGLWDAWAAPDGKKLLTFTIVTTQANDLIKPLHERMPVILPLESEKPWLDPESEHPKQALFSPSSLLAG